MKSRYKYSDADSLGVPEWVKPDSGNYKVLNYKLKFLVELDCRRTQSTG
jgi:hypothetical protein